MSNQQQKFTAIIKRRFYLAGLDDKRILWHEHRYGFWHPDYDIYYIYLGYTKWKGKLPKGTKPTLRNLCAYKPKFKKRHIERYAEWLAQHAKDQLENMAAGSWPADRNEGDLKYIFDKAKATKRTTQDAIIEADAAALLKGEE